MTRTECWYGLNNSVLYMVQFEKQLADDVVTRIAHFLLTEPFADFTPAQEYAALAEAVQSDMRLTRLIPEAHSEQAYRDFLQRLLDRMDAMRPWPELPFRCLNSSMWHNFANASPIARIGMSHIKVMERLRRGFDNIVEEQRKVLILRLRSGDEVALVTPWWPENASIAVLQRDPQRLPQQVVTEFLKATGFTPDEVMLLS